jgi:hypothetical protein
MTTPPSGGLLTWGQAGQYNAVDDRMVIAALANRHNGMVTPAVLSAGSGLAVNVAAGWLAVASCADSTLAVIGSRVAMSITVPAGPATGSATYLIWADVNPDAATFTLNVITSAQAVGRAGVQLGTVTAPAGSNTAAAMTLTPTQATFANFQGITFQTDATGGRAYLYSTASGMLYVQSRIGTAGGTLVTSVQDGQHRDAAGAADGVSFTPQWSVPVGDIVPYTHYSLWAHGNGTTPAAAQSIWFDVNGLGGYTRVNFANNAVPVSTSFAWTCEAHLQVDFGGANVMCSIKATIQNRATAGIPAVTMLAFDTPRSLNPNVANTLVMRCSCASQGGLLSAWGSTFMRNGGQDPTGQITP